MRSNPSQNIKRVNLVLPEGLITVADELAEAQSLSRSQLLRQALEGYVEQNSVRYPPAGEDFGGQVAQAWTEATGESF